MALPKENASLYRFLNTLRSCSYRPATNQLPTSYRPATDEIRWKTAVSFMDRIKA